ncbi:E4 [Macaca mulatta papillomavirus 2]|uniref:E4 n=1 Tax=Macaca mulatta papillomavirus 2 TaxID=2294150 RepID=A0A385AH06_9PAPI|nr:E4 [Macaca mulatta papillomavirus 2]AXN57284.1 E4 [Macaca mulatta papillomavirus 2]
MVMQKIACHMLCGLTFMCIQRTYGQRCLVGSMQGVCTMTRRARGCTMRTLLTMQTCMGLMNNGKCMWAAT